MIPLGSSAGRFFCLFLLPFFLFAYSFPLSADSSGPLSADEVMIEESYVPGTGSPVGHVRNMQGQVIVIHPGKAVGYLAAVGIPVFQKDTILTRQTGVAELIMMDESVITLAPNTQMTLTRSLFDPESKTRSSFIGLFAGKARFLILKYAGFTQSEVKIKTKTAVVGVRGSEFIVTCASDSTEIVTLKHTVLEVTSIAGLEEPPIVLSDYEKTVVKQGELPLQPVPISTRDIEELLLEMRIVPHSAEKTSPKSPKAGDIGTGTASKSDSPDEAGSEDAARADIRTPEAKTSLSAAETSPASSSPAPAAELKPVLQTETPFADIKKSLPLENPDAILPKAEARLIQAESATRPIPSDPSVREFAPLDQDLAIQAETVRQQIENIRNEQQVITEKIVEQTRVLPLLPKPPLE